MLARLFLFLFAILVCLAQSPGPETRQRPNTRQPVAPAPSDRGPTFAERLGWARGDRVLILHMDDAGMSYDSNAGIEHVIENGLARSLSVMMPCPWVPAIVRFIKNHPEADAGLHLTLTSEWKDYRWAPLAGAGVVPGLIDQEGAMWSTVASVAARATPDEVGREIRAQLDRAERMGFHPTHLDSHMGTLFANAGFLERYVRLGMENRIPVMLPGGHDTYIRAGEDASEIARLKAEGRYMPGTPLPSDARIEQMRKLGEQLWRAGLPVLDDLHNDSYDWKMPPGMDPTDDDQLRRWRTGMYIKTLDQLKPGVTMVIMHCTAPTEMFGRISDSGLIRRADMLSMTDPAFARFLKEEGFFLTTWRELMERRQLSRGSSFK